MDAVIVTLVVVGGFVAIGLLKATQQVVVSHFSDDRDDAADTAERSIKDLSNSNEKFDRIDL